LRNLRRRIRPPRLVLSCKEREFGEAARPAHQRSVRRFGPGILLCECGRAELHDLFQPDPDRDPGFRHGTGICESRAAGGWSLEIAPRAGCNTKVTDKAIVGTPGADRLIGTSGADIMAGLGGDDLIKGLGGNDKICGSDGGDRLKGGKGSDRLYGEAGKDSLSGQAGKDSCSGGKGRDSARGCEKERSI
jgi:hemolysin type calcium-binding protein